MTTKTQTTTHQTGQGTNGHGSKNVGELSTDYKGPAIWQNQAADVPVTVLDFLGEQGGESYMQIAESKTGIPLSELRLPQKPGKTSKKNSEKTDSDELTENEWSIEQPISFQEKKQKLHFHLLIVAAPPTVTDIKRDFATVRNSLGVSKTEAIKEIFLAGLMALLNEGELESVIFNPKNQARAIKLAEIEGAKREATELSQIYQALGREGFCKWCEETGHDAETFLKHYTYLLPQKNKSERITDFLKEYLADRQPRLTEEIKAAMLQAGVIDSETGWNYAKTVANREGFTKNAPYGFWQLW